MSIDPFFKNAVSKLASAQKEVIALHGQAIFRSEPPDYKWPALEAKRSTCPIVQAYYEALADYENLEKAYMVKLQNES
jgi:hypothetical protein